MTTGALHPLRTRLVDTLGALASVVVVFGAAAVMLYAVDALPALVTGEPRHVRRAATVDEVERRLRARLVLPYYFPNTYVWPPRKIRYTVGPPASAAVTAEGRDPGGQLLVAETLAPGAIPPQLIPDAQVIHKSPIAVGPYSGTLSRVVEDGLVGWQITWQQGGRNLLVRSRGSIEELLRIARSAREAP